MKVGRLEGVRLQVAGRKVGRFQVAGWKVLRPLRTKDWKRIGNVFIDSENIWLNDFSVSENI